MSKTVNIFLDDKAVTWGDGTHLNHNDATFRANIKADTAINGSGYFVNNVPSQLTYSNATFTTPKPIKLVLRTGSTNAIDLATAYSNAGQSLMSSYAGRPALNGSTIRASNNTEGTAIMFGVLNDIARKADGSAATNNTEAVYFEIVWQVGKLEFSFDFVGIEAKILDFPNLSGNGEGAVGPGYLYFDRTTYQPSGGDYIATRSAKGGFRNFIYAKNTAPVLYEEFLGTIGANDGDIFRIESSKDERGIVNITDNIILSGPQIIDVSSYLLAPFLYVSGGESNSFPCKIDNAKIVITNPA